MTGAGSVTVRVGAASCAVATQAVAGSPSTAAPGRAAGCATAALVPVAAKPSARSSAASRSGPGTGRTVARTATGPPAVTCSGPPPGRPVLAVAHEGRAAGPGGTRGPGSHPGRRRDAAATGRSPRRPARPLGTARLSVTVRPTTSVTVMGATAGRRREPQPHPAGRAAGRGHDEPTVGGGGGPRAAVIGHDPHGRRARPGRARCSRRPPAGRARAAAASAPAASAVRRRPSSPTPYGRPRPAPRPAGCRRRASRVGWGRPRWTTR